jgi:hypothetical protein
MRPPDPVQERVEAGWRGLHPARGIPVRGIALYFLILELAKDLLKIVFIKMLSEN